VKDPLEDEYEDKGCDECDEEFFPVHNFSVEVTANPQETLAHSLPVAARLSI
jgi:hypothetical protein